MNKNENLNFISEAEIYFIHIGKQLLQNMFAHMNIEIVLKKYFNPKEKFHLKEVIDSDDIYLQSMSALVEEKLNYYIKNLEIIIKEDEFKLIDLKYEYYNKNENILNTNIQIKYVE